ncbi:hypothetical protein D9611_013148 [Ephemerocybe angulata]|uniref:F-box domain-containing protein n=1 Tax=Ephemerocybe angulata TaxID=980116 RepID=A0A8H5BYA5_9AGAR|nr:hypothetical protein D9611_013148 [Tulosesus angulatus]
MLSMRRPSFITRWVKLPIELKELIFSFLSLSDIISFCDVSLPFRLFALEYLRLRLTQLTEQYDLSLYTLMLILDRSNTVISGSVALELVHPTGLRPNNLDFFCPNQEADGVCSFLLSKNYNIVVDPPVLPLIIDDVPGHNCIDAVTTLRHGTKQSTIHVIVSSSSSPLAPIFASHSTFVMNFISASGIYSCYPGLTEQNTGMRNITDKLVPVQPRRLLDQEKYVQRGFSFIEGCPPLSGRCPHPYGESCLHRPRCLIDPITAVLPLDAFRSSCSFWPRTEWRLGCLLKLSGGDIVTAETLIEVHSDGTDTRMHGNNLGRVSLAERAILSTITLT